MHQSLSASETTFSISEQEIGALIKSSSDHNIIGQPRGVKAIELGLNLKARGYNLFVTGQPGTGRRTAVKRALKKVVSRQNTQQDIVLVYNFSSPDHPSPLYLKPGRAPEFQEEVHELIERVKVLISGLNKDDVFRNRELERVKEIEDQENNLLSEFEAKIAGKNFLLSQTEEEGASDLLPLFQGEQVNFEVLRDLTAEQKLSEEELETYRDNYFALMDELQQLYKDLRMARRIMSQDLVDLQREKLLPLLTAETDSLANQFPGDKTEEYLNNLKDDILKNVYLFTMEEPPTDQHGNPAFIRYGVNILKTSTSEEAPVIWETRPDTASLFGTADVSAGKSGDVRTNYLMIRPGSMIKASGGFLILMAEDIFACEGCWEQLKRVLDRGEVEIRLPQAPSAVSGMLLKPEPVKINTKVIIIGPEHIYETLYDRDEDFLKHFKVDAEFDTVMPRTKETMELYIQFAQGHTSKHNLRPLTPSAYAQIIRFGVITAEEKEKLSTRFTLIADLITEADHAAKQRGSDSISGEDVQEALDTRRHLANLPEEKMEELVISGDMMMDFTGKKLGQVNGLAVHDRGFYAFGAPVVISARIAPGDDGLVNIEREVGLSGEIHDKWMLILQGYLRSRHAQQFPLSMYASICFEQSYGEIEGDSASAAELFALLSAIAGIPLRQDLAVTGSVNQTGDIQPVGGITEKVSGFFSICQKRGLTGTQGVLIPKQNIKNLILTGDAAEAVGKEFFIYPITNVDQGISLLSGMDAGKRNKRGLFPQNSFNGTVERKLRDIAGRIKGYSS